ncbi:hypothetical protein BFW01_g6159 [Lasiodiplodia theobromae]|uniref:Uncharacterized protein n=1 Tax=Lasiodiplodia theobromae TaxID=45133 RepID=A0A5N5DNY7_9PEZI|nr:uncharacterized protein LTHEOB_7990 [Lasiodiplodia theobromae]KAB2579513.1 hypothetical protein DBV05_g2055 [Lasiodiplodia theobromae]KAF4542308.1 hypothetical protein LTHEOB_7990 [Lasiodiplodia theobromae]KAF9635264.1 hypothetical protein BFW01_g6159 [Lasiodiplodia theobromae]
MSTPPEEIRQEALHERRQSIGKYVKRLRTVLKRGNSSKERVPTVASSAEKKPEPAASTSAAEPKPESKPVTSTTGQVSYPRSAAQQERARALFAKYGLTLEAHEWITSGTTNENVQRVEKPIRMRVHRQCHRCQTTFGADRVCQKCEHTRCKKCPRYPAKKEKTKGKGKEGETTATAAAAAAAATPSAAKIATKPAKKQEYLTIKSRTGGPDLERRPPKQRVRRHCHKCQTLFIPATATVCTNCQHTRCTKCPRDPAKKKKWPDGYPGDVPGSDTETDAEVLPAHQRPERVWRKPRMRIRWSCEHCNALFMEKTKTCAGCGHERCPSCVRIPPKKAKKEPDPAVLRSVEEKLARFKMEEHLSGTESAA